MPFENKQTLKDEISQFSYNVSENTFMLEVCEEGGSRILTSFEIHGVQGGHNNSSSDEELIDLVVTGYLLLKFARQKGIDLDEGYWGSKGDLKNVMKFIKEYIAESIYDLSGDICLRMTLQEKCSY